MRYRVSVRLLCPSESDAVAVRDAVAAKVAEKALFNVDQPVVAYIDDVSQWIVACDVRFEVDVDASDVHQNVQAKWTSGQLRNRIMAGSTTTLHACTHDDAANMWRDCRTVDYVQAVK